MHTRFSHLTNQEFIGLIQHMLSNTREQVEREFIQEIINRLDPNQPITIDHEPQRDLFE